MIVRDLVSKISGVDYLMVYKNNEFICYISDEDLDKDLPILDSEVCSVEVVIYDGWGDDVTGDTVSTKEIEYYPTRTCIIFDCLDISSCSENFKHEYWNSLLWVCRLGRSCWQSLIFSSRSLSYETMPSNIVVNIPIRIMFDGDRITQYRMFDKEVSFVKDKFLIDICGSFGTVSIW